MGDGQLPRKIRQKGKDMNKLLRTSICLALLFHFSLFTFHSRSFSECQAQNTKYANFARYAKANTELGQPEKGEKRVVLLGNSITDNWAKLRKDFFKNNALIGRGISGQTSDQFLLRFREDVINLKPYIVVINSGTNDIAENSNTVPYNEDLLFGNIVSIVELARYNKIKVILTSCLPAEGFRWNMKITNAMDKIRHYNERLKAYAKANKIPFVDYFSALVNEEGTAMKAELGQEMPTVHPNEAGYEIMEKLLLPVIEKMR